VESKLVAITAIGSRLILVICSPGELPDLGQVQAERFDPGQIRGRGIVGRSCPVLSWTGPAAGSGTTPTLPAVHDPRKISVDLAVASGGDRHHANHRNQATVAHLNGRYF